MLVTLKKFPSVDFHVSRFEEKQFPNSKNCFSTKSKKNVHFFPLLAQWEFFMRSIFHKFALGFVRATLQKRKLLWKQKSEGRGLDIGLLPYIEKSYKNKIFHRVNCTKQPKVESERASKVVDNVCPNVKCHVP